MKKAYLIVGLILLFIIPPTYGQTDEATTEAISQKEIQDLKVKIANKVAELNKDKKATAGTITDINNDVIKIKNEDNKELIIKIDSELTKYYQIEQAVKKEIKVTDLKKDAYIIVSGLPLENTINANSIYQDKPYIVRSGKITEVNKTDYYLRVMSTDKDEYILDIENITKQQIVNIKTLELERTGFSKIKEGDTIHFVVAADANTKENNRYPLLRFLIIPQEYF